MSCGAPIPWPEGLPAYDHVVVVVVVEENKDYGEVVDSPTYDAPYINDVLKREGAVFTRSFGSQPIAAGLSFKGYAQSLPGIGSTVDHTLGAGGSRGSRVS